MSEPAVEPAALEPAQGEPAVELGDGGVSALKAERARANSAEKATKALQAQLDQINAEKLTDIEKATQRATEAEKRATALEQTALRQKVALTKGLPADLVDRLRGDDEDSLTADADSLLALLSTPTSPRADPSQGAKPAAHALNGDPLLGALKSKLGIN